MGVMLGSDLALVEWTDGRYRCIPATKLAWLRRILFDEDERLDRLPFVLTGIAEAPNRGDLVKAQLLELEIPLGELDDHGMPRLAAAAALIKASPNDPKHPG